MEYLLRLAEADAKIVTEAQTSGPLPDADELSPKLDPSLLPDEISTKIADIVQSFDEIQSNNKTLAEELLNYYDQFNMALEAITVVAHSKTTAEAVRLLTDKLNLATKSRFSFYLGSLITTTQQTDEQNDTGKNIFFAADNEQEINAAREFFARNKSILQQMPHGNSNIEVKIIDYHGDDDPDLKGHGNVMAVKLTGDQESDSLGTLFFVRADDKHPFVASDMNLVTALGQMGSAVLGNIISNERLQQTYLQTIIALARAVETKDAYTSGHSSRVADLACKLARHIHLAEEEIQTIEWAGLLHDVGKIGIRDDVLSKPGELTDEEFAHIKTHPIKSYNVLEPIGAMRPILAAVRHHHEHFDGKGYPDGLKSEDIPLYARILQVADVWDALTSTRAYRKAMSTAKAREILHAEAGSTMDPELVKNFLEMIQKDPA